MSKYIEKDIQEIHELLVNKKIKPIDLVEDAINTIKENSDLNCFITLNEDGARKMALELENIEVEKDNLLFGIPIAVKDNIGSCRIFEKLGFNKIGEIEEESPYTFYDGILTFSKYELTKEYYFNN